MFNPGWQGGPGRPKGSKNTLPIIRDRIFRILLRRIVKDKDLEDVSTEALIKFVGSCLPKDMSLSVTRPTQVTYISNIPRAELEDKVRETITREVGEDDLGEDQNHPDR